MANSIIMPTNPRFKNLTGCVFERLTVVSYAGKTKWGNTQWLCRCECGTENVVPSSGLRCGDTRSCGCLSAELSSTRNATHRCKGTAEYRAWASMKNRCNCKSNNQYRDYGGRGIVVCERWKNSFELFLADMGHRPSESHSIDRIDNDGDYEPSNCRWATKKEQSRNTRRNRMLTLNGKTRCLAEWSVKVGIPYDTIICRIKLGWTVERALTTPVKGSS